jgi:hypothetical protein
MEVACSAGSGGSCKFCREARRLGRCSPFGLDALLRRASFSRTSRHFMDWQKDEGEAEVVDERTTGKLERSSLRIKHKKVR